MSSIDLTMTDPAEEQTHSEAVLATIGDLVVWHQMPYLPTRRLIQLNCERWPVWNLSNKSRIAKARRLDNTRDWYFPIVTKKRHFVWVTEYNPRQLSFPDYYPPNYYTEDMQRRLNLPPEPIWSWSGIWHESAHHTSEKALMLPPLNCLPHRWLSSTCPCYIVTSAGGLLLIDMPNLGEFRREVFDPIVSDTSRQVPISTSRVFPRNAWQSTSLRWRRLLVCNPLTKEFRELPAANCRLMGWPDWDTVYQYKGGAQTHMVVNDEANSYQVILIFEEFMTVYSSTTKSWNSLRFPTPRSRALNHQDIIEGFYYWTNTQVGGRHFFADVNLDPHTNAFRNARRNVLLNVLFRPPVTCIGLLRIFEVDIQAGRWHLLRRYTLRKFQNPLPGAGRRRFLTHSGIIRNLELVGCMGDLYAVFPARLHDVLTIETNRTSASSLNSRDRCGEELVVEYIPLVFFVMQLLSEGDGIGMDHAELRIPVPQTMSADDLTRRNISLSHKTYSTGVALDTNWFACEARGNVIWVSFDDYLLSYDVVSRESTAQIIAMDLKTEKTLRLAYRPSFHMKP